MAKTIVVKQIGSPIRRPAKQRQTLIGLGLNKMHKTRELEDTPAIRGMVNKISFTGSTADGKMIGEVCGRNLVSASLELGGKNH